MRALPLRAGQTQQYGPIHPHVVAPELLASPALEIDSGGRGNAVHALGQGDQGSGFPTRADGSVLRHASLDFIEQLQDVDGAGSVTVWRSGKRCSPVRRPSMESPSRGHWPSLAIGGRGCYGRRRALRTDRKPEPAADTRASSRRLPSGAPIMRPNWIDHCAVPASGRRPARDQGIRRCCASAQSSRRQRARRQGEFSAEGCGCARLNDEDSATQRSASVAAPTLRHWGTQGWFEPSACACGGA